MVVAQRPSDFVEMKRCASALQARGFEMLMVYFLHGGPQPNEVPVMVEMSRLKQAGEVSDARIFELRARSLQDVRLPSPPGGDDPQRPEVLSLRRRTWSFIRPLARRFLRPLMELARHSHTFLSYLLMMPALRSAIAELRPNAIILPEDVVGVITPLVIRSGHQQGVASIVIPYTIANQSEAFQSLRANPSYQFSRLPNFIVGSLFPRWVMRKDGVALVRLPAPQLVGQEITRTAPPDPWMMNSGYADVIAVENEAMQDYYRAAGIPSDRMRVVGAIYDDTLAGFVKNKEEGLACLRAELGIKSDRPLLTIGGCPDQSKASPRFDFADMQNFCDRLASVVSRLSDDYEILVRPHPNYPEKGEMLAAHGFRVTMLDTARLVALSDAYIAFGSATIRWAIACGVPTINYDVFGYDYDDFKAVSGVANVADIGAFERAAEDLRRNGEAYAAWRRCVAEDARRWGTLDGRSVDRIAALVEEYWTAMHRDGHVAAVKLSKEKK